MEDVQLNIDWDDIVCPICLDIPHNSVLLQCSSYDKGCRALVCDTNQLHSNCLDRFKTACGESSSPVSDATLVENREPVAPEDGQCNLTCPLCRGQVSGWIVVDKARTHLDEKKRCCDEVKCKFTGSYLELQNHAQLEHPHACPSKIDPARLLDWENFQQSSEIIDVLSTIHSEIPRGMVLGDYVIEYGDDDGRDEYDDFPGDDGNWWTSCILYQMIFRSRLLTQVPPQGVTVIIADHGDISPVFMTCRFACNMNGSKQSKMRNGEVKRLLIRAKFTTSCSTIALPMRCVDWKIL
ncbi:putative cellulose synthase [Trifolium repens]|nr:putative cellulose synthase [Trifolium repens]